MFTDWSVDVDQADDDEAAGSVNRPPLELPSDRHVALYRLLRATARRDQAGRLVSWWPQPKLAARLGVSVRTLRRVLDDLREPGLDPRHPRGQPPGLRLGVVRVEPTSYRDSSTGRHRLGGNLYVLVEHGQQATPAEPVSAAQVNRPTDPVACLNKGENHKPVSEGGLVEAPRAREPIEIPVEPPEAAMLDHHPDVGEVLGVIGRSFGEVLVLQGPATYRTARGRLLDLAGPLGDFRTAVDQLDRDTCMDGGCQPGHPCRRHIRRNRARG
jgi:hypothetical protein